MWIYENLGLIISGIFIIGLSGHFTSRRRHRRSYVALRDAYEEAVREVRESGGDAAALVRGQELHREFMRAYYPGWFEGFGRRVRTMAKVCAALTLLAFFLKGPIERGEEEYARKQAHAATAAKTGNGRLAKAGAAQR